ncbi:nascent polypeptide-associated complex subunit alpha, muscle-specific form-like isoform X1 [Canis lupus familiaris]|uniref:nascent polypeptide-associated complex subunit alpha, muscle-specific form-like isoform X1 n=1 Tax=Canis lupus familiaris TaxID=9615 RepID=UPI0018F7DE86|nr:nascent polypeptide-associated complex subunit alpha, muscle-specific form-like isoform X1 [Canis lupus familiaris]
MGAGSRWWLGFGALTAAARVRFPVREAFLLPLARPPPHTPFSRSSLVRLPGPELTEAARAHEATRPVEPKAGLPGGLRRAGPSLLASLAGWPAGGPTGGLGVSRPPPPDARLAPRLAPPQARQSGTPSDPSRGHRQAGRLGPPWVLGLSRSTPAAGRKVVAARSAPTTPAPRWLLGYGVAQSGRNKRCWSTQPSELGPPFQLKLQMTAGRSAAEDWEADP